jgi:hypothetical protein
MKPLVGFYVPITTGEANMFLRTKFVTNSSSTSFLAFGVELEDTEDLYRYLIVKNPDRIREMLSQCEGVPDYSRSTEDLLEYIERI